jgi:hypothetical protein
LGKNCRISNTLWQSAKRRITYGRRGGAIAFTTTGTKASNAMNAKPELPDRTGPDGGSDPATGAFEPPPIRMHLMGREFSLPQSRLLRMALGVGLILLGILGFLPVLGFWMIPLGLLILSYDFAAIRRLRRRLALWWGKRKAARRGNGTR